MCKGETRQSAALHNAHKFKTTTIFRMEFIQGSHNSELGITVVSEHLTQSNIYLNNNKKKLTSGAARPELKLTGV